MLQDPGSTIKVFELPYEPLGGDPWKKESREGSSPYRQTASLCCFLPEFCCQLLAWKWPEDPSSNCGSIITLWAITVATEAAEALTFLLADVSETWNCILLPWICVPKRTDKRRAQQREQPPPPPALPDGDELDLLTTHSTRIGAKHTHKRWRRVSELLLCMCESCCFMLTRWWQEEGMMMMITQQQIHLGTGRIIHHWSLIRTLL